ncbi:hypothetical protein Back11_18660 [Paenibacillus baekrokdamisoli]|uniref:Uncharacterized protein n=1 Tax=Paenibacillus baekrokdamisoli TaxID=1712516 RepID=A0A3G9J405_9BACL|nr:hypothetical protein Back11_18660 [Paenibacillus baekrokdamisoli]
MCYQFGFGNHYNIFYLFWRFEILRGALYYNSIDRNRPKRSEIVLVVPPLL